MIDALREHGLAERTLISTMEPRLAPVCARSRPTSASGGRSRGPARLHAHPSTAARLRRCRATGAGALPAPVAGALRAGEIDALMAHWAS